MCVLINWSENWLVAVAKCMAAVVRYCYIDSVLGHEGTYGCDTRLMKYNTISLLYSLFGIHNELLLSKW